MDQEKQELEKIKEKYQARNKYINNYMRDNYDRVVLLLPKGYKNSLTESAKSKGYKSITEYIKNLIDSDNNSGGDSGLPETNSYFDSGLPFG